MDFHFIEILKLNNIKKSKYNEKLGLTYGILSGKYQKYASQTIKIIGFGLGNKISHFKIIWEWFL